MTSQLADDLRTVFEESYNAPRSDISARIRSTLQDERRGTSFGAVRRGATRQPATRAVGSSSLGPDRKRPELILRSLAVGLAVGIVVAGVLGGSLFLLRHAPSAPTRPSDTGHHTRPSPLPNNQTVVTGTVSMLESYPGTGVQLHPPGPLLPTLSAATVLGFCSIPQSTVTCETGPPKSIDLGLLTDTGMGIQSELVWAMTWTSVNCDVMGPFGRPTPNPRVNDATGCDLVTFVDAKTGRNPEAIRGPFGL
jgi:hypothetical protein